MAEAELARFIDHFTVEFVRTYPHPVERVWKAVSDPAQVAIWFIRPTIWNLTLGGSYRFHDDGFAGVIQAFEPPRLVRFGPHPNGAPWPGAESYFQFELEPVQGGTRLRFLQHAAPGVDDPDERREGLAAPGRPGSLAGWHDAFDRLAQVLDGVPAGSHLRPTRLSEIAQDWAARGMAEEFTPVQKARILKGLRARERWFELADIYTAHVRATRPCLTGGGG